MASLDALIKMNGVVAAGQFGNDGKLVDVRGTLNPEVAQAAAQFCGTVNMLFKTMSGSFEQLSGMPWTPAQGWAFAGAKFSVCVGGDKGVFIETGKADYNTLFKALMS
jgi:roadblock/LC7 domain-containing protein